MNKLRSNTLLITVVVILLILVLALWQQNSGLKEDVVKTEDPLSLERREKELEALQQQLDQLLELKESLE